MWLQAWREGWRSLRQDWRVAVTAVALLAVTIGAVTAVFAVAQAIVFRPFPFVDQERIAVVWQRDDRRAVPIMEVSYGEMAQWRARTRDFAHLGVVSSTNWGFEVVDGGEPIQVEIAGVSSSFFPVVGTPPQLGRWLVADDDQGDAPRTMVISHGLWTRRFGADPSLFARARRVKLAAEAKPIAITAAGVMPAL
jgi:hypothetical protein